MTAGAVVGDASGLVVIATPWGLFRSTDFGDSFVWNDALDEPIQRIVWRGDELYAIGGWTMDRLYDLTCTDPGCYPDVYRSTMWLLRSRDRGVSWERRPAYERDHDRRGGPGRPSPSFHRCSRLACGWQTPPRAHARLAPDHFLYPSYSVGTFAPPRSIAIGPDGALYIATPATLLVSTDRGDTLAWRSLVVDGALAVTATGTVIAAGRFHQIARSDDDGFSWSR